MEYLLDMGLNTQRKFEPTSLQINTIYFEAVVYNFKKTLDEVTMAKTLIVSVKFTLSS